MFDKKDDNSNSTTDVFRPAKGSAKVVIGHGVTINGEIKKADEVQIDGEADVTMKTDNVVIGATGDCKGNIETHNADIWGKFDGEIKKSNSIPTFEELKRATFDLVPNLDIFSLIKFPIAGVFTISSNANDLLPFVFLHNVWDIIPTIDEEACNLACSC